MKNQCENAVITVTDLSKSLTLGWWNRRKVIRMFKKRFGKQAPAKDIVQWATETQRPNLARAFIGRDLEITRVFLEAGVRLGDHYAYIMAKLCESGHTSDMAYLIGQYHGESKEVVDLYALAWVGI
jgi:hypothetical protein